MRMREATIAAGIWLTFGIGGFGELYVALTWDRPHRLELALLFALAVAAAALVLALPSERIVRSRLREPFFLAWTVLDFAMLVVGTLADGGTASPLVLVFFIPVVFSSMSYPLASVVAVGAERDPAISASPPGLGLQSRVSRCIRGRPSVHRRDERLAGAEPQAPAPRAGLRLAHRPAHGLPEQARLRRARGG